jgi:hypothetical protein
VEERRARVDRLDWARLPPRRHICRACKLTPPQGQTEDPVKVDLPAHDPKCYLCPGNTRMGGDANPDYKDTFVSVRTGGASEPLPSSPQH